MIVAANPTPSPKRPRLQFSVRSLMILTTVVCIAVAWFSRPPRVKITSYLQLAPNSQSTASRAVRDGTILSSNASHALTTITSQPFLQTIVAGPLLSQLDLIKNQSSQVDWLEQLLDVEIIDAGNGSNVLAVSLILPESQEEDGMEIVKVVVFEYENQVRVAERQQLESRLAMLQEQLRQLHVQIREYSVTPGEIQKERGSDDSQIKRTTSTLDQLVQEERKLSTELKAVADELVPPDAVEIMQNVSIEQLGRW